MTLNRLRFETSPYLRQHEKNPVDWYPWGSEALERARREDKPILLSVGYSACHWCHVMAHESFENSQIAQIMNDHYINIKVDREERPDLDQIYQVVAQMITRGGGWPLTVFLTPDLKPFYGGTYFPPTDRYGRPGFPRLLLALAKAYREDRAEIQERAEKMTRVIQNHEEWNEITPVPVNDVFHELLTAARNLLRKVDWQNGGIGGAPKFPNVSALSFLWKMSLVSQTPVEERETLREAVILALEKMRCGGIFDQLGGGFARYSVDDHWAVPHFEKMLYDNALLLKLYSEVLLQDRFSREKPLLTDQQKELFLSCLRMTVEYVKREMASEDHLFYAAQDADSEGEEGKFFVWTQSELHSLLSERELEIFAKHFGVTENGNFEQGANVLFLAHPYEHLSSGQKQLLDSAIHKVWHEREKRIHPGLDDKSLISWNGLMISGLAWAALAFEATEDDSMAHLSRELAVNAFDAVLAKASTDDRLAATVQVGEAKRHGYLDDYAFMAQAALDLARIDPARSHTFLVHAETWVKVIFEQFTSETPSPGFFFTANDHESLIHRPKSLYDQAIPSGSGVAYGVIQVLIQSFDRTQPLDWHSRLEQKWINDSKALIGMAKDHSFGMSEILSSMLLAQVSPIIVKGSAELEYRAHPFFFEVDGSVSPVQYCHQQSCHLDPTVLSV